MAKKKSSQLFGETDKRTTIANAIRRFADRVERGDYDVTEVSTTRQVESACSFREVGMLSVPYGPEALTIKYYPAMAASIDRMSLKSNGGAKRRLR